MVRRMLEKWRSDPLFSVRIPARSGVMSTAKAKTNVFRSQSGGSPDFGHAEVLRMKYFMIRYEIFNSIWVASRWQ